MKIQVLEEEHHHELSRIKKLTLGIMIQESSSIKFNRERVGRKHQLVNPENDLVTYYEMKINKKLRIKHKHTEFKLSWNGK